MEKQKYGPKLTQCQMCNQQSDKLYVWTIPDPYYGYGHFAKVVCNDCDITLKKSDQIVNGFSSFMYDSHPYDYEFDNYYLGLTKTPPLDFSYINWIESCWDCQQPAGTKVGTCMLPHSSKEIIVCESCFRKRDGKFDDLLK